MATRVRLNHAGMRELLSDAGVRADLEARGARVLAAAQASAPYASGAYQASLGMSTEEHSDRVVVHVGSDAPHATIVEAGHGTLSRALDAAGGG